MSLIPARDPADPVEEAVAGPKAESVAQKGAIEESPPFSDIFLVEVEPAEPVEDPGVCTVERECLEVVLLRPPEVAESCPRGAALKQPLEAG